MPDLTNRPTLHLKDDPVHGLNTAIQHPLESAAALIEEYMAAEPVQQDVCPHCGRSTYKSLVERNTHLALDETVKKLRRFAAMKG